VQDLGLEIGRELRDIPRVVYDEDAFVAILEFRRASECAFEFAPGISLRVVLANLAGGMKKRDAISGVAPSENRIGDEYFHSRGVREALP
jgi:hypothetical protein